MKKIDFRLRPPYKHYLKFYEDTEDLDRNGFGHTGVHLVPSIREKSMELLLKEMDEAEIVCAVVPGRADFGVTNEELFELLDLYPGRFIIYPFIDPLSGEQALMDIDRYVVNGPGKGVAIECGFTPDTFFYFDEERLMPFYQKLNDEKIPLMINYSAHALKGMPLDLESPKRLDILARRFPNLTLIIAHGGFPWSRELIALAMIHTNVYLLPDAYGLIAPAAEDYWIAARTIARGKILFGSAHPLAPTNPAAKFVEEKWGLDEISLKDVLYDTAAALLGIVE